MVTPRRFDSTQSHHVVVDDDGIRYAIYATGISSDTIKVDTANVFVWFDLFGKCVDVRTTGKVRFGDGATLRNL